MIQYVVCLVLTLVEHHSSHSEALLCVSVALLHLVRQCWFPLIAPGLSGDLTENLFCYAMWPHVVVLFAIRAKLVFIVYLL